MTTLCSASGVTKVFDGRPVVSTLSFGIHSGEFVAITGPSGAGKSTVLNLLGLLDSADRGHINLFGDRAPGVRSRAATMLRRRRLAYLFQNFALVDSSSVLDNLKLAQRYVPASRTDLDQARRRALRRLGLAGSEDAKVFQLSGGEQQRVAIARLFVKPCELILADEPTGSLDGVNRDLVLSALEELRHQGKTIVIVTHDPVVVSACDRSISLAPHRDGNF